MLWMSGLTIDKLEQYKQDAPNKGEYQQEHQNENGQISRQLQDRESNRESEDVEGEVITGEI